MKKPAVERKTVVLKYRNAELNSNGRDHLLVDFKRKGQNWRMIAGEDVERTLMEFEGKKVNLTITVDVETIKEQ